LEYSFTKMVRASTVEGGGQLLTGLVSEALQNGRGLAVGKLGTSEFNCIEAHLLNKSSDSYMLKCMTVNAGIWPHDTLWVWFSTMRDEVLPEMDCIVEWNSPRLEIPLLNSFAPGSHRIPLRALEPYYQADLAAMWTRAIPAGTKVAVVTPFAASVAEQIPQLPHLFPVPIWNEGVEFVSIKTGCSPALDREGPAAWPVHILEIGWQAAVHEIVRQVVESGARVALIGCGALSLPVAVLLKEKGVVAVHTGGATQILFGVMGGRWDTHSVISTFFNEHWIRPSSAETPRGSNRIEGGCYW
jgi:hypothetical protein